MLDAAALVLAFALDLSLDLATLGSADLKLALIFIAALLLLPLAALDMALIFMAWRVELLLPGCRLRWPLMDLAALDLALIFNPPAVAALAATPSAARLWFSVAVELLLLLLLMSGCGFRWPLLDLVALDLALIFMAWRVKLLLLLAAIRLSL